MFTMLCVLLGSADPAVEIAYTCGRDTGVPRPGTPCGRRRGWTATPPEPGTAGRHAGGSGCPLDVVVPTAVGSYRGESAQTRSA